ncbi:hypothetical protein SAMN04488505_10416 [Chitinophaga rupis]|uniref:Uncharacterized protein n=1 Tax=Chitinophaga rupis TaxID=573321 RepID=A0A1H7XAL4_9BACT|nr:hypothetical protein [Chitinophaga rupis]SEM30932.1 hypothetical protein SAMN04488505_10416 [Chitinophaga rupis]
MAKEKLKILGRASDSVRAMYLVRLGIGEREVLLFCDFSEFDIPIGAVFTIVKDMEGDEHLIGEVTLKSVTQGFFLPFDMVPAGHKTLCAFDLGKEQPKIIQRLSAISDWYESKEYLILQ